MRRRPAALTALACSLAVLGGCFEDPVAESLELRFLPGHALRIAVRVRIHDPESSSTRLKGRLDETRRVLLAGDDAWSPRFAALAPAAERRTWEKTLGELSGVEHEALLDEPAALARFFADSALGVAWTEEQGRGELAITPYATARANAHERAAVDKALVTWSDALAAYFERTHALYEHLERHPERATPVFGRLFRDDLEEQQAAALPDATAEEERLAEAVRRAMREAAAVLVVEENEASSLDEMSHHVYDPFPAKLTVKVPGRILELEGFAGAAVGDGADAILRARGVGFWDALAALRGRWLTPNPLLLHVAHERAPGDAPFDLASVAAAARHSETPTAREIREAIEERLRAEPLYRVVWSTSGLAEELDPATLRRLWADGE